ncbi:type II toxin-antitoxin system VapC family toxin [Endothiovibrio diazotrophicus]
MKLLLDTHALLWWLAEPQRLPPPVVDAISDPANTVHVSVATAWECAIKQSLGKLRLPAPISSAVEQCGFTPLEIRMSHVERFARLPHHHRAPFDWLLAAQALEEALVLVTHDGKLRDYPIPILWS